ncbi:MAG TPA: serine/threonine-protein kinase, partial [Kofleriaceae bacterium]|nr:serine/threonine-protein kinase [Kofleriaceae bacterium]
MRLLGEGRTSRVYLAEHTLLGTWRAVKLLGTQPASDPQRVRRFIHEACVAARLHHRNTIGVHDVGQGPDGSWFMVLDHLEGEALARHLAGHVARAAGPLPAATVARIVTEIAEGLTVAHEHGILHCDLRPEKVFLIEREGAALRAVLLGFGMAQLQLGQDPDARAEVHGGLAMEAPAHLSPEQLRGGAVTPATDIFALGVVAYRMVTGGWFPYQGDESGDAYGALPAGEIYARQMTQRAIDPRARCAGIGEPAARLILAALDVEPTARPASPHRFAQQLA